MEPRPENYGQAVAKPRRSLLDLAPLELDCMSRLWRLGEGTVREIRDALAATRPRAYTTIMTIMDRLASKGLVSRRKVGRAYIYRPNLSLDQARDGAVARIVEHFFSGSYPTLARHLSGGTKTEAREILPGASQAPAEGS